MKTETTNASAPAVGAMVIHCPLRLNVRWDGRREHYEAVRSDAPHFPVLLANPELGEFAFQRRTIEEAIIAVNSHADLLDLLTLALPSVEESEEFDKPNAPKLSKRIRETLAKAEGGTP